MSDYISRQDAIDGFYEMASDIDHLCTVGDYISFLESLSAQPEIIRCKDCKHNPNIAWFVCPAAHLSEKQRPETAWCWKAERRTDEIN